MGSGESKTAGGGISPQQMSLANYTYGEDVVADNQAFGKSGVPQSTMHTQSDIGALAKRALFEGKMDIGDRKAMSDFINQQTQAAEGAIGSLGSLAGGGGGGGGGG